MGRRPPGKARRALGATPVSPRAVKMRLPAQTAALKGLGLVGDGVSGAVNGAGLQAAPPTADEALWERPSPEPRAPVRRGGAGLSALAVPQRGAWKGLRTRTLALPRSPARSLSRGRRSLVPSAPGPRAASGTPGLLGWLLCVGASPRVCGVLPLGRRQLGLALYFQDHPMPSPQSSGVKECPCLYIWCLHMRSRSGRVCH